MILPRVTNSIIKEISNSSVCLFFLHDAFEQLAHLAIQYISYIYNYFHQIAILANYP